MQIQKIDILKNKAVAKQARAVYDTAFPRAERMPWWLLRLAARRGTVELSAYLADGRFCGFTYHILTDHAVMILYFAVDGSLRAKGYGSAILAHLKEVYADRTLLLHIEPTDAPDVPNRAERCRRLAFYQKNGFCATGYDVTEIGGRFSVLANGREVDVIREYRQAFRRLSFGLWKVKIETHTEKEGK